MGSFWEHYSGVFIRPRRTFASLLADSRKLRHGSIALSISAFLYSLATLFLALAEGEPIIPPFLPIPAKDYYFLQVFFMAPVMITAWVLASGAVQFLSKLFGGNGRFRDTLSLLGFGIAVPTYVTLVPDTASGVLSLIGVIGPNPLFWTTQPGLELIAWSYLALYNIWFLVLFSIVVATTQKLHWRRATIVGAAGYIVYQSMLLIFAR